MMFNKRQIKQSSNLSKQITIGQDKALLNFLEESKNLTITTGQAEEIDLSKIKISKQFKLINSLPKLMSVPATP